MTPVASVEGDAQGAPDQDQVEQQDDGDADKAEFLPRHGEDEVRVVFGQETQLALGSLHPALAEEHAAADGDFRLDDVVPGAVGIQFGVQKDADPVALVLMEQVPEKRRAAGADGPGDADPLHLEAADPEHAARDGREDQGRSQVGLPQDQHERDQDEGHGGQVILQTVHVFPLFVQEGRQADDHEGLREFTGLEGDRPDADPPLGPQARMAEEGHRHQQDQHENVELLGNGCQRVIIDAHHEDHDGDVDPDEEALTQDKAVLSRSDGVRMGRAADQDQAGDHEGRDRQDQDPVHVS